MSSPPVPPNETARRAELARLDVLDTPYEDEFDALTRLAADLCDTPIALISLVDAKRPWFKARFGLDIEETPRDFSFCAHGLHSAEILEIEDAKADSRFADDPLVTGPPHIRFYAGAPLRTLDGHALGTLCVIDRVPRRLTRVQRTALKSVAKQVLARIGMHLTIQNHTRTLSTGGSGREVEATQRLPPLGRAVEGDPGLSEPRPFTARMHFGRFLALHPIGMGAMSAVYAALDEELGRTIAVKFLHANYDREDLSRIHREAQALARISHPNVVQIYETGIHDGRTFIAMEFVQGVTLSVWQTARKRTIQEVLAIYVAAGRGLVAAHQAGIVHRDFKPDNVLVGVDGRPRVADFGLARLAGVTDRAVENGSPSQPVTETAHGTIIGTPAYMSPEQYGGDVVDERADQFSFCTALFEALYGRRPFNGASLAEIRVQVVAESIDEPEVRHRAPPYVHEALRRGLASDPSRRWSSLSDLLDHLARYDPASEPSMARREQRSFTRVVDVLMVGAGVAVLGGSASQPSFYTPGSLLVPTVVVLLICTVYMWVLRDRLVHHRFHWLMLRIILVVGAAIFLGRAFGVLAGQGPVGSLMLGMVAAGTAAAGIATFVAPVIWKIAAAQLVCAACLALSLGPTAVVDVVAQTVSALLLTRAWRLSGDGDYLRLAAVDDRHPLLRSVVGRDPPESPHA